jgi:flagellar basal-body rod protein FlgF
MKNAVYIGLSQQMALKRHMDITANNIANMNTTAYKGVSPVFQQYLVEGKQELGKEISFVQDYGVFQDMTEGSLTNTGRPLDLSISGDGYFSIRTDAGIRYTRNGNFKLDNDGFVVTSKGDFLIDERGGTVQLDLANPNIEIAGDGTITLGNGETQKLALNTFENEQLLKSEGYGYYNPGDAEPIPTETASINQGSLEGSNVIPVLEMTNMIDILRTYQAAQKLLDAEHDMQMKAIEELPATN